MSRKRKQVRWRVWKRLGVDGVKPHEFPIVEAMIESITSRRYYHPPEGSRSRLLWNAAFRIAREDAGLVQKDGKPPEQKNIHGSRTDRREAIELHIAQNGVRRL